MKMRNIYILSIITFLFCYSCTDLDVPVHDELIAENYYANFSEDDIPAAIGKVYSDLRNLYAGGSVHKNGCWLYTNEEVGDLWITPKRGGAWYDAGIYVRLNNHEWNIDEQHFLQDWRRAYSSINNCNRLIYEFREQELKDTAMVMAELKVARAFWYYTLVDMFGNVPVVTQYDVPDDYLPATNSREEVFNFVVSQLEENIPYLKEDGYGRWNKYSASQLLAKTYLNAEVWAGKTYWDEVIALCDTIIESQKYVLEADYSTPFKSENENSKEIIMGVANDEVYHEDFPWRMHMWTMHWWYKYHANTETFFWGGPCATPDLAWSYDPDDLRYTKSWLEGPLYDNTGEKTGTIGAPLLCDGSWAADAGKPIVHTKNIRSLGSDGRTTGEADGVRMQKYEIKTGAKNRLENDFVLFRYADVFFMKAEAIYRKNGKAANQEVVDLINKVRQRAFTDFSGNNVLTAAQLNDNRFLLEYAWEFCQEGHRRQQLIRFGQFTTKRWFWHTPSNEDYRNLFPIPRDEILANPNLIQNPGY
ncbi:RagB/SusD family nutrient uptake outer membrane protein [Saccharicrinis sp. FJH62]|uniref:RagB/SusD family nutrient uptake outer membrane protein n=1 Tax=Saccharicrinis sp. FJH62 TaxID=3344657 RepID=UPI0035D3FBCC